MRIAVYYMFSLLNNLVRILTKNYYLHLVMKSWMKMQNLSNEITAMSYLHKNNKDAKGEYGISHTITILNTNSYTPWDLMGWVEIEREG